MGRGSFTLVPQPQPWEYHCIWYLHNFQSSRRSNVVTTLTTKLYLGSVFMIHPFMFTIVCYICCLSTAVRPAEIIGFYIFKQMFVIQLEPSTEKMIRLSLFCGHIIEPLCRSLQRPQQVRKHCPQQNNLKYILRIFLYLILIKQLLLYFLNILNLSFINLKVFFLSLIF